MSNNEILELLARLSQAFGPSGYEDEVRRIIVDEMKKSVEKPRVDPLGNVYAEIQGTGKGPKTMVSAHMDEVGFVVKYVEDSGFLRFGPLGGIDPRIMLAQRVLIRGSKPIGGVIGSKPPHILSPDEAKKTVEAGELYIDIGASSREEANKLGVEAGTAGTFDVPFKHAAGSMVVGKALDNRAGCAAALKLLESMSRKPPSSTLVFAFTVQEELGSRGATVAANSVLPDVALVFESAVAADSPGVSPRDTILTVGKGPAVRAVDNSMITQRLMFEYMKKTAEAHGIPYQIHINFGGATDAGKIHLSGKGIPTGVLSTPCRYLHGPSSMLNILDLESLIRLAEHAIRDMHSVDMFTYEV